MSTVEAEPEDLRRARSALEGARAELARLFEARGDEDEDGVERRRAAQDRYGAALQRVHDLEAVWGTRAV